MKFIRKLVYPKPKYVIDEENCRCNECTKKRKKKIMEEETSKFVDKIFNKYF